MKSEFKLCAFFMFICTSGFAFSSQKLTIVTETLPPYNFEEYGKVTGINIEATRYLCKLANIECEFKIMPWNRAYRLATSEANVGIVSTSKLPEREDIFHWVGPLAFGKACFFKLRNRTDIQIDDEQDLLNYSVGLGKNLAYEGYFNQLGFTVNQNLFLYNQKFGDLRAFSQGRLDLIVASVNTLPYQIQEGIVDYEQLEPVFPLTYSDTFGNFLALHLDTSKDMVDKLQLAAIELHKSGKLKALIKEFQPKEYANWLEDNLSKSIKETCL
ncbi:substrate-binding periplasmic protein [Ningiella sp. W23]|uniref:substrate-binding periplasmic protein n=1 Tax=Ningiella sp. W23 TaxID=3023715 RepID=UPI0037582D4D